MKKYGCLFLILALLLALSACGSSDVTLSGSGTEADPYLIDSPEALWQMARLVNGSETQEDYAAACYLLTADIDLGGHREWTPLGEDYGFSGVLDGGGHTIRGLKIDYRKPLAGQARNRFGLVAQLEGTVRNLTISDSFFRASGEGSPSVGAIAGSLFHGTIENCATTDSVTVSSSYQAGGICGKTGWECTLRGCTNAATVSAQSSVGGAAGIVCTLLSPLEDCVNTGTITSEGDAAGIAVSASASVSDCTNSGSVSAVHGYAAGITTRFTDGALNSSMNDESVTLARCSNSGSVSSSEDIAAGIAASCRTGTILDCVNSGSISCVKECGGILGYFQPSAFGTPASRFTVSGCRNSGDVTVTADSGNSPAGGICGTIWSCDTDILFENCENTGTVFTSGMTGVADRTGEAGGIIGSSSACYLTLSGCSNSGSITGVSEAGGLAGSIRHDLDDVPDCRFLARDCRNTGNVIVRNANGLCRELYAGGILGNLRGTALHSGVVFENCENTGTLSGDTEGVLLFLHDLCGASAR